MRDLLKEPGAVSAIEAYSEIIKRREAMYMEVVAHATDTSQQVAFLKLIEPKTVREQVATILRNAGEQDALKKRKHDFREFIKTAKFIDLKTAHLPHEFDPFDDEMVEAMAYLGSFGAIDPPGKETAIPLFRQDKRYLIAEYVRIRAQLHKKQFKNKLGALGIELCERRSCVIDSAALGEVYPGAISSDKTLIARSVLRKCDLDLNKSEYAEANNAVFVWRTHCWVKVNM